MITFAPSCIAGCMGSLQPIVVGYNDDFLYALLICIVS